MSRETKVAIRHVLRESSKSPSFFDLSDSERLVRMLRMAFELGRNSFREVPNERRRSRQANRHLR